MSMKHKLIKTIFSTFCLLLILSFSSQARSESNSSINIEQYHQLLDAINKSNAPDNVKDQLFQDMRTTLIESVRQADIPDDVKRTLIKDLESTTR